VAVLKEEAKQLLVQSLACYDTPSQAAELVKQELGVEISRMQAAAYDPTKPAGRNLSQKWRDVFEATRKAFIESVATVPIAQQAFRLRVLQRALEKAEARGNAPLVAQLLEQAAKELGGAFTNRRELTGKDGRPLVPPPAALPSNPVEAAAAYQKVMQGD